MKINTTNASNNTQEMNTINQMGKQIVKSRLVGKGLAPKIYIEF